MNLAKAMRFTRANWFVPMLSVALVMEWILARSSARSEPTALEAVILFDLCLFVPFLYWLCYRRTQPAKALAMRAVGLACFGVFIASRLVPPEAQTLLPHLAWVRTAGIAVVALVELKLFVELIKLVFGGQSSNEQIAGRTGAPPLLVKLMALEARFWKAVWRFVRGR